MNNLRYSNDKESRFHLIPIVKDKKNQIKNTDSSLTIIDSLKKINIATGKYNAYNEGIYIHLQAGNNKELYEDKHTEVETLVEQVIKRKAHLPLPSSCVPPLPTMTLPACRASAILPILLSESNSLSLDAMRAIKKYHESFGVIQFSAHANLYSSNNQCEESGIMRTITEELNTPLFQIGVRELAEEEKAYRKEANTLSLDASTLRCPKPWSNTSRKKSSGRPIPSLLPAHFPDLIYLTFSVDAFDSSIMPATKKPEPGGLFWWDALHLIERSMAGRVLLGFDVVGFTSIPNIHAYDHTVAKLVYEIMSFIEPINK